MTAKEYIKFLDKKKKLAVDRFGNLTAIDKSILDASFAWLTDNLSTDKGKIVITDDIDALMNEFVNAVVKIVTDNKDYQNKFSSYLSDVAQIGKNLESFHSQSNKIDLKKAGLTDTKKGMVNLIADEFTESGINANFVQPLKDIISRNVVAGMSLREAKGFLQDYIIGGQDQSGKLDQYLVQTAQQGVDSYTGAINSKLADTFTFTGFIISGSLIATSSKQCRYAIDHADAKGFLNNAEWQKVLDIARNNKAAMLIEGTTLKNLPIRKLHWGCRHEFTPVL